MEEFSLSYFMRLEKQRKLNQSGRVGDGEIVDNMYGEKEDQEIKYPQRNREPVHKHVLFPYSNTQNLDCTPCSWLS